MKVLVLGGTIFLGRHVVDELVARGHEVTIYSRGLHGSPHPDAEHVQGDRADLAPLQNRQWDAAIDTSGFEADQVQASAGLDLGHYVFVSSCNAYPDWPEQPVTEDSPTWQDGEGYGQGKAASERVAHEAMGGRFATVRAGLIVGPHDNIFRLPWWIKRLAEGGTVPAPGAPDNPIQIIDARDLASFLVDLAEQRTAGAFNGTGPETTWGKVLGAAGDAELVWIPDEKLQQAEVAEWTELPMWLPAARYPGTWNIDTTKAQAAGLTTRPVEDSVRDIRTWLENGGERELGDYRSEHRPPAMSAEREAALLRLMW